MAHIRPICILIAALNIAAYLCIFFQELPNGASRGGRPLEGPFSVRAPQSIAQSTLEVVVSREICPHPIVRVRLIGPEIHAFPSLRADANAITSSKDAHIFAVDLRKLNLLAGEYKVEASLLRCNSEEDASDTTSINCTVVSEWNNILQESTGNGRWPWVPHQTGYVFAVIDGATNSPILDNLVTLKDGTAISKPTSLLNAADNPQSVLQYFSALSNYELVCWMGDDDAQRYYQAFMQLFPLIGSQRPFKFKYIRMLDVSDPTRDFSDTTHQTFDKCKIFFISYSNGIDARSSPVVYGQEVATLVDHIEKSHPDQTYPAWFLSLRSTASDSGTRCHDDSGLQRNPDRIHEFNKAARSAIHTRNSPRIHYMDNADLSESVWPSPGIDSNTIDNQILLAVAMRCLEEIAETVQMWRSSNQIGTQRGLSKNGTLISNDELYKNPYTWG